MNTLLREQLSRLGWPGILGIGLIFFCMSFYLSALAPLQAQIDQLLSTSAPNQKRLRQIQPVPPRIAQTPEQQLRQFYQQLPAQDTLPEVLDKLYDAANRHGISLEKGEYLPRHEKAAGLVRYQIALPVKGGYPQLRRFIRSVLHDIPSASLDRLHLEKQHVNESTISAELQLSIYLLGGQHGR